MSVKPGMPGRRRRRHGAEFKAKLIEECQRPGVSMAAVALANGINANLLRTWVSRSGAAARPAVDAAQCASAKEEFIALTMEPRPGLVGGEIRIELRRGTTTVTVSWPASSAGECAAWLRAWLR